jgi:hypothetical protein
MRAFDFPVKTIGHSVRASDLAVKSVDVDTQSLGFSARSAGGSEQFADKILPINFVP